MALVVLYVLHFNPSNGEAAQGSLSINNSDSSGFTVAYIHTDSLQKHYQYVEEQTKMLQNRTSQMERDLQNRAEGLQREIADFQNNYGNLTIGQARALEEDLAKKEQNLRVAQERARQQLLEMELVINQELYTRVTDFLKEYSELNDIDMVVKFNTQSDVLYAGEGLDITKVVVEELNKRHLSSASAADSTKNN